MFQLWTNFRPASTPDLAAMVGLLTERQTLILKCLYDEERDVAEVAVLLKIDAQTVRSTHHKALLRLRAHFGEEPP